VASLGELLALEAACGGFGRLARDVARKNLIGELCAKIFN
jgi:hypothetical protein